MEKEESKGGRMREEGGVVKGEKSKKEQYGKERWKQEKTNIF